MQKKHLLAFALISLALPCAAQQSKNSLAQAVQQFQLQSAQPDVLDESDDIKTLVLKYAAAADAQKPAIKAEIEKKQTAQEEEDIKAQELRIKRQEEKIKEIKADLEVRKKNKDKKVQQKVEILLSADSVEKIKAESVSKKIKDKIKSKAK